MQQVQKVKKKHLASRTWKQSVLSAFARRHPRLDKPCGLNSEMPTTQRPDTLIEYSCDCSGVTTNDSENSIAAERHHVECS